MRSIRFSAIVVTHNSSAVAAPLLEAIPQGVELIVVDNASTDRTQQDLLPRQGAFIRNGRNLGYGAACNRGAREAEGEILVFLNPDMRIPNNLFYHLRVAATRYPDAAAYTPRLIDRKGRAQNRDYNFIARVKTRGWRRRKAEFEGDCCVEFAHGGLLAVRKDAFWKVGGFDEGIFLYYEDDDLSYRLQQAALPVVYVHDATSEHGTGGSSERSLARHMTMSRLKKRSEIYIRRKYALPYSRARDGLGLVASAAFYALTLRPQRLYGAIGRLRGVVGR